MQKLTIAKDGPKANHDPNKDVIGDGKTAGLQPFADEPTATDDPNESTPESATENTQRMRPDLTPDPLQGETFAAASHAKGYQRLNIAAED